MFQALFTPARYTDSVQVTSAVPRLRVFAHVDATAGDIAPHEAATADAFEKAHRDDVAVTLQMRHVPSEREYVYPSLPLSHQERWLHRGLATGSLVGLGGLAAGAILSGNPVVGVAAGLAGLALGAVAIRSGSLLKQGHSVSEPEWEGTRTYEIGPDKSSQLDSPVLEDKPEVHASVADLARHAQDAQVTLIAGHGHGYFGCAGFSMKELQLATRGNDLVVFESCLMSNLEALSQLDARYAVASENTQLAGLEQWKPALEQLSEATPEALGRQLLAEPRAGNTTRALLDLDKVDQLKQDVEALAKLVPPEVAGPALRASTRLEGTSHDFRDLGSVLENLAAAGDASVKAAAARARASLKGSVLASQGELSQLSIQGPDEPEALATHARVAGMPEWSALLARAS